MLGFRRPPAQPGKVLVGRLYEHAVRRSRDPVLYVRMGAPDTAEGRFELLTAHILLLIERLNLAPEPGPAIGQMLFDLYIHNLDGALREMGVGDLAVGKRMKGLGKVAYGRAAAYREAFATADSASLEALLSRTLLAERPDVDPAALAVYLRCEKQDLDRLADEDLLRETVREG